MSTPATAGIFARDVPRLVESTTGHLPKYPAHPLARWGLRLAIFAAFAGVALWYHAATGGDWSNTANAELAERVSLVNLNRADVNVVGQLYPPVSGLAALIIPGGALGLALAGSAVAAYQLQTVAQALQRRGLVAWLRGLLLVALALTPFYGFITVTNFPAILGLTLFGNGMMALNRFVVYANTQAGFRAGILIALATLSYPTVSFAALIAFLTAAAAPQSRTGARLANGIVAAFPTVATICSFALLGLAFGAGPFAMIGGTPSWQPEIAERVLNALTHPIGVLYFVPTALIVIAAIVLGVPLLGLIAVLLTASTVFARLLGFGPPAGAGDSFIMSLLFVGAILSRRERRLERILVGLCAVLVLAVGWAAAFTSPNVLAWLSVIGGR